MMVRLCTLILAAALATLPAAAPRSAGAQTGDGVRVLSVDSLAGFTGFFNLAQGTVRIVALVSPTAPECSAGIDSVVALLQRTPSRRLRAYVIFLPALESDTHATALERSTGLADGRIVVFWNENGSLGEAFGSLTATGGKVWNGFFLYDTGAAFEPRHPAPAQLAIYPPDSGAGIESGLLAQRAQAMLLAFEAMRRETQKATE